MYRGLRGVKLNLVQYHIVESTDRHAPDLGILYRQLLETLVAIVPRSAKSTGTSNDLLPSGVERPNRSTADVVTYNPERERRNKCRRHLITWINESNRQIVIPSRRIENAKPIGG